MVDILSWRSSTAVSSSRSSGPRNADNRTDALLTTSQVYERPLGTTERCFYWDSVFARTADIAQSAEVEVLKCTRNPFTTENILNTWTSMKQQFPLLAAQIRPRGSQVFFVVEEKWLHSTPFAEVVFRTVTSSEDANTFIFDLVNNQKHLSNDKVSRLFILSESNRPDFYHVVLHAAHCITDGVANIAFIRIFLDQLSSIEPAPVWDIKRQLALSVSSDELVPEKTISVARRRWHQAIGWTLASISSSRFSVNTSKFRRQQCAHPLHL